MTDMGPSYSGSLLRRRNLDADAFLATGSTPSSSPMNWFEVFKEAPSTTSDVWVTQGVNLPTSGPLFPELTVDAVTKWFAKLRGQPDLGRSGLVFHSSRKWFITQCERTGDRTPQERLDARTDRQPDDP